MADSIPSNLETLQQIWQRVFQRSSIGVNEDFFDLGGDAWLAAQLITEINNQINNRCAVDLPATILCNAPTIAALAPALRNAQLCGQAILLKQGTTQAPPLFMLHGIGSSVVELVPLVRRMQIDPPIYGLEAKGNDGREAPLDRIEDIAQSFVGAIREIQPRGPYFLVGYSLGGLIAFEIAQQMKAQSEEVGLLVMLDSYPDRRFLSFTQYARLMLQRAKNRVTGHHTASPFRRLPLVHDGASPRNSLVQALQRTKEAHYRALHNYRPRFYEGEVKFVRPATPSHFPADPVPVWSSWVRRLEVETVSGQHITMLRADPLASMLDRYVLQARARHAEVAAKGKPGENLRS